MEIVQHETCSKMIHYVNEYSAWRFVCSVLEIGTAGSTETSCIYARIHGITSQKTVIFIASALRNSAITLLKFLSHFLK
jgi:hypothetical protein